MGRKLIIILMISFLIGWVSLYYYNEPYISLAVVSLPSDAYPWINKIGFITIPSYVVNYKDTYTTIDNYNITSVALHNRMNFNKSKE